MPSDRAPALGEAMRVLGAILLVLGFLLSLSIVGAIVGIPMMLIGLVCLVVGGRRKTVITNVVQVSNVAPPAHGASSARPPDRLAVQSSTPLPQFQPMQRRLQDLKSLPAESPVIEAEYREERSPRGAYIERNGTLSSSMMLTFPELSRHSSPTVKNTSTNLQQPISCLTTSAIWE